MKRANTMSAITVELTIKVKTKFTSSNAENTKWIHLTTDVKFSQSETNREKRETKRVQGKTELKGRGKLSHAASKAF